MDLLSFIPGKDWIQPKIPCLMAAINRSSSLLIPEPANYDLALTGQQKLLDLKELAEELIKPRLEQVEAWLKSKLPVEWKEKFRWKSIRRNWPATA
jgi:hypothetical protein